MRRLKEVPEIHADPHMDPDYESAEEEDDKKGGTLLLWFGACQLQLCHLFLTF